MANVIGGVLLPRITAQRGEPIVVGGRYIDTWQITVPYLTYAEFTALEAVVRVSLVSAVRRSVDGTPHTNEGAQVSFKLKEWPTEGFKMGYITRFNVLRTPFRSPTGWDPSGRTVEIDIEEA